MKIKNTPPYYLFTCLICIVLVWIIVPQVNLIVFPFNLLGILPLFFGFSLMGKVNKTLKNFNTPHTFAESTHLVTTGAFSFSRNPMYLGMFLLLIGWAILFLNFISLVFPLFFFMVIQYKFIPFEEQKMHTTFGDSYVAYKQKVRKWI